MQGLKQITNQDPPCSTGNSTQYSVTAYMEQGSGISERRKTQAASTLNAFTNLVFVKDQKTNFRSYKTLAIKPHP